MKDAVGRVLAGIPLGKPDLRAVLEAAGCEVIETDRTTLGMSGSLVAGIEAAESADGWIVALGDMPRVRVENIRAVADALCDGALIALPVDAGGKRGHPVGFASGLRHELLALQGDVGAREILARHDSAIRAIETDDPGIFVDIDTPRDLESLKGQAP
jgi:Uncharacterized MobA-related protein